MTTEERLEKLERELAATKRRNRWLLAGIVVVVCALGAGAAQAGDTVGSVQPESASRPSAASATAVSVPNDVESLIKLFREESVEKLKAALDAGLDPNHGYGPNETTAMEWVIMWLMPIELYDDDAKGARSQRQTISMLELMIEHGGKLSNDSLSHAVMCGCAEVVDFLLKCKVDPNKPSRPDRPPPMYYAVQRSNSAITKMLIDHGAKVYDQETVRQIRFVYAAQEGDALGVRDLLTAGANVNGTDPDGRTALVSAAEWGRLAVVWYLLEHKADPNWRWTKGGDDPIHAAVTSIEALGEGNKKGEKAGGDEVQIVKLILAYGGNVSSTAGERERTPLHIAAKYNMLPIAKVLIDSGAKVMAKDADGKTPLDLAESGPMIRFLKEHGAKEQ